MIKYLIALIFLFNCSVVLGAPLTPGRVTKAKSDSVIMDSTIYDNGTNVGMGSTTPRGRLDVVGSVYATTYYGSGANLTDLPASMTYPTGDGVAVVSGGASWGTTLATDGAGDCASGSVCLGDHTHTPYALLAGANFTGNVGLGSATPRGVLDIKSGTIFTPLTASRCVETAADGSLTVAAGTCGTGT